MYIDPGSGSMAFQFLVAGVLGLLLTFWRKLLDAFRRMFGTSANIEP